MIKINLLEGQLAFSDPTEIDSEKFNDLIARIPLDGPNNKDEVYFLIAGFIGYEVSIDHPNEQKLFDLGSVCADWWVKK